MEVKRQCPKQANNISKNRNFYFSLKKSWKICLVVTRVFKLAIFSCLEFLFF